MSLFNSILEKLGMGHTANAAPPSPAQPQTPAPGGASPQRESTAGTSAAPPAPQPGTAQVDVSGHLEKLAAASPQQLNWKTSIVDLLKLLGLDSSLDARKALAVELGCPVDKLTDSAQMNMWLHKTVLQKLAQNGGNVPPELLR
jgi:hypothetical protein